MSNTYNCAGFATLTFLILITLILAIVFSFAFTAHAQTVKSDLRNLCLIESILIQKKIIGAEKKLLSFNTLSTYLSTQLTLAYAELALATETENGIAAAIALKKIQYFEAEQLKLDTLQKKIIFETKNTIILEVNSLLLSLENHLIQFSANWNTYLLTKKKVNLIHLPKIAVHPDSYDLAPNYQIDFDHNKTQTVAFNWQYEFRTNNHSQKFIESKNLFSFACGSGLLKIGEKWKIEINEDKF